MRNPPAIERIKHLVQEGSDFYAKSKVWMHWPTNQFPKATVFLSFGTGNANTFAKVSTVQLRDLATWLVGVADEIDKLRPEVELRERSIADVAGIAQRRLEALRNFQRTGEIPFDIDPDGNEVAPDDIPDEEEDIPQDILQALAQR